jgi:hypothetical protein
MLCQIQFPSDAGVSPVVILAHAASFGSVAAGGEKINAGVYFIVD